MTTGKRIALNVAATYGRSLVALVCGLLGARWILQALGQVDYGLWGVVGGLVGFVSFFNGLMSLAVARFLAVAVGRASVRSGAEGEEVRNWFWTAVLVHGTLATVLVLVGGPIGEWVVRRVLTIPPERMAAAVTVWRCVVVSTWVGMAVVPWSSLYVAKQEIAEQTVYSVITNVTNTAFLAWMAWHPGDWLGRYAIWSVFVLVVPQLVLAVRAHFKWPEIAWPDAGQRAQLRESLGRRLRELGAFAGWRMFGALSGLCSNQGIAVAVNKFLGPAANASVTIGNTVAQQSAALGSALCGALSPAIANAAGAGDIAQMRQLTFVACRVGTLLVLLFTVPLVLEIDTVMSLWLGTVPEGVALICSCVLVAGLLEKLVEGHWMSILALGRIRGYQLACAGCGIAALGVAAGGLACGRDGFLSVGLALVLDKALALVIRLWFGWKLAGLSVVGWIRRVIVPCALVGGVALTLGMLPRLLGLAPGFVRVAATAACSSLAFLPMLVKLAQRRLGARSFEIDLVYCWCNGAAFKKLEKCRFSDNGELYYSIRSVDRFAPWFRTIWVFVNDSTEIPDWLANHPKVRIVTHSKVIPRRYLPLYNAVSIEFWLGDIPGLAEHFVYANDDMFLCRPVRPGHFFTVRGEPICRYEPYEMKDFSGSYGQQLKNNRAFMRALGQGIADSEWRKAECHTPHHNMDGYRRSVLKEFCAKFPEEVEKAGLSKFRSPGQCQRDVFSLWAMATGRGVFRSQRRGLARAVLHRLLPGIMPPRWESLLCSIESTFGYRMVAKQRPYMCCLNDNENVTDEDRRRAGAWMEQTFGDGKSRLDGRLT